MALLWLLKTLLNLLKIPVITTSCVLITLYGHAQDPPRYVVAGTIVSAQDDKPLAGATITIKGSSQRSASDLNGNFHIVSYQSSGSLQVTFIGYNTQNIEYSNTDKKLIIQLTPNSTELKEVVISNGFQNIPKERATGSFVLLDSAQINRRVSTDVLSRLEGIVPGLIFNHNTAASTGSVPDINIRGHSTLFANDQPLIIMDNFPYDGNLNNLNPNDIASMTVLKDAAAASIWGVRSGNGVIVITTKKGKANQRLQVELNSNLTIGQKPDVKYDPNFLNSTDFIDVEQSLFKTGYFDNALSTGYQVVSPVVQLLANVRKGTISADAANNQINALRSNDVRDDISQYFYRRSVNQQYNLNFKGGGQKSDYYTSVGFDNAISNLVGNQNSRITINSNLNFYPIKNLQITSGLMFTKTRAKTNNTLSDMLSFETKTSLYPYARLSDANGNALPVAHDFPLSFAANPKYASLLDWYYRPLDELKNANNNGSNIDNRISAGFKYSFLKHLNAQVNYAYETATGNSSNLYGPETYYARNLINRFSQISSSGSVTYPIPLGAIMAQGNTRLTSNHVRGQLNYNQEWKEKNAITALLGSEWSSNNSESFSPMPAYGYNAETKTFTPNINYTDYFAVNPADFGSAQIPNSSAFDKRTDRFVSYFANAAYSYDNKYVLSGSARIDKSNLFGVNTNQKAIPLFSTGASWEISKEDFYHVSWLPYAKIKVTFGYNGNVIKTATAVTTLSQVNNSYYSGVPYDIVANPGNPNLKWEKNRVLNFAFEFALPNQVIAGSIEPYFKKAENLYGTETLAPSSGYKLFYGNTASTSGHGIDITVNSRNIIHKNFQWTSNFLYSFVQDKVTKYGYTQTASSYLNNNGGNGGSITPLVGAPVFGIYSLKSGSLTHDTGFPQGYLNGQLSTDYAAILNSTSVKDLVYNGPSRPTSFGSLRNNFSYQNVTVSFNIIYKFNYFFKRSSIRYGSLYANWAGNADYSKRWQKPGDELTTSVPSMQLPPVDDNLSLFYLNSESLVENGSHIRLQDINVAYDLTKTLWKRSPFTALSIYGYINNVGILWRANHSGLDPDVFSSTGFTSLPSPRTFSIGLKMNFK